MISAANYSMLSNQAIALTPLFPNLTAPLTYQLIAGGGTLDTNTGVYAPGAFTGTASVRATDATGKREDNTVKVTTYAAMTLAEPGISYYYRMGEASGSIASSATADTAAAGGGTITYAQAGAIAGDSNNAILVNGGYFTTGASVNLSGQNVSFDVWVKRNVAGTFQTVFSHGTNTTGLGMHLALTDTNYIRYSFYGGGLQDLDSPTASETDTTSYHHFTVTYETATQRRVVYKDGLQIATISGVGYGNATATSFRIGDYVWGAGAALSAVVDEMTIYIGTVLTPAQALRHYRAGKGLLFQ
jgi:Concanavalin A-like lectin/glucanases superfamily